MISYQQLLAEVLTHGKRRNDRTGTGTLAVFGRQLAFNNTAGPDGCFPATTIKPLPFAQMCGELASFIEGTNDVERFKRNGCNFWNKNAEHTSGSNFHPAFPGDLGRIYGVQWREWRTWSEWQPTDQLKNLIQGIKENPFSRRHIVLAYNPGELDQVCLPACHVLFQCFVSGDTLELLFWMRSVDLFLGLPCDIALYALLQRLIALECNLLPGRLVAQLGDAHIYLNHLEQVSEALRRRPYDSPELQLSPFTSLFGFKPHHAVLENYQCHPPLPAAMAQ